MNTRGALRTKSTTLHQSLKYMADKEHKTVEKMNNMKITFLKKKIYAHLNLKHVFFSLPTILDENLPEKKKLGVKLTVLHCQEKPMARDISNSQSFHH